MCSPFGVPGTGTGSLAESWCRCCKWPPDEHGWGDVGKAVGSSTIRHLVQVSSYPFHYLGHKQAISWPVLCHDGSQALPWEGGRESAICQQRAPTVGLTCWFARPS
eukprot:486075-Amphidinium_carterae.1